MDKIEFYALGSIVNIKGTVKKVMVIARGLASNVGGAVKYFDYGGCTYPEGLIGEQILYFNHDAVIKVVHEGFADEDDAMMVENLNEWIAKADFERGDPLELNKINQAKAKQNI